MKQALKKRTVKNQEYADAHDCEHRPGGSDYVGSASTALVATAPAGQPAVFPYGSRSGLCLGRYYHRNSTRADYLEQRGFDRVIDPPNTVQRGSPLPSTPVCSMP
jgi:hypothetical protein